MTQPSKINQQILTGEDYVAVQIEAFLNERKAQNLAEGTIRFYRENLLPFLKHLDDIEVKFISQITPSIIRDYLILCSERGHNSGGVHCRFRSIKAFLKWYWDEMDLTSRNPISKVKAPKVNVEPIEGISKEDFNKLLNECPKKDFFGIRDRAILMILLDTGVRASELCNINIEDIDFSDSSILIRQGKGRKPRFVFIGKKARKQLRKYLRFLNDEDGALFINRDEERITYITLREILRRLYTRAGTKRYSPHDFRRAFCLECLRKGIDLLTISRLMGHSSLQMISRYAKQVKVDLMDKYISPVDN